MQTDESSISIIKDGVGRISCRLYGDGLATFSELSSTYPLKLLSPRVLNDVAIVYILTYGGGLVGGDLVSLSVDVKSKVKLVLLTQVCDVGRYNIAEYATRSTRALQRCTRPEQVFNQQLFP